MEIEKRQIYCLKEDKSRCKKCIKMFTQIYCLVRLDQRLQQHFDTERENTFAQAGEGSWGYTEASYARIILYNELDQDEKYSYLQGSLTFVDTILSNLICFLQQINNCNDILNIIKRHVSQTLTQRQQSSIDEHGEIGYFGRCNIRKSATLTKSEKIIEPSPRHTAGGLSALILLSDNYNEKLENAYNWLMQKIKKGIKTKETFELSVDNSCFIRSFSLLFTMFSNFSFFDKKQLNMIINKLYSDLHNYGLRDKELYGKDKNDPLRVLNSLWILDYAPLLKPRIKKKVIESIISHERKGGIPFWLGLWPKGRKEIDSLIPNDISYEPDFGLTASLINILCKISTINDCDLEFCKKHSSRYFDWLLENFKNPKYFYGTNSRQ